MISFADDTPVIVRHGDLDRLSEIASTSASRVFEWMTQNGLPLNTRKTKCMLFGKAGSELSFKIHRPTCSRMTGCPCDTVTSTRTHKFLGLHIDDNMKFSTHIDRTCAKMRAGIAILARIRDSTSVQFKCSVFHALVGSHANYMLSVYGTTTAGRLSKIDVLLRRAIKVALKLPHRTPSEQVYDRLGALPIVRLREMKTTLLLYPTLQSLKRLPHDHNTRARSSGSLYPPRHAHSSARDSPASLFISLFNQFPEELRNVLDNQNILNDSYVKRCIRQFFFSKEGSLP